MEGKGGIKPSTKVSAVSSFHQRSKLDALLLVFFARLPEVTELRNLCTNLQASAHLCLSTSSRTVRLACRVSHAECDMLSLACGLWHAECGGNRGGGGARAFAIRMPSMVHVVTRLSIAMRSGAFFSRRKNMTAAHSTHVQS